MDKVIEVKNLSKTYGKRSAAFAALKNINLDIYAGESVAIVGKSGSGKSTLMHLLALLDRPTTGTIKVDGVNSTELGARKLNHLRNRSFGFVFQQFFMNPNDTVLENVMLPLAIAGVSRKQRKSLAMKALTTVGLKDRAKFKANDLSGGQKQRVCIARAIVNDPEVIFADEPTGNLDSATGEKIINLLFEFNRKKGATLIIVTHDEELASLCSRQIRIMDGRVVEDTGVNLPGSEPAGDEKLRLELERERERLELERERLENERREIEQSRPAPTSSAMPSFGYRRPEPQAQPRETPVRQFSNPERQSYEPQYRPPFERQNYDAERPRQTYHTPTPPPYVPPRPLNPTEDISQIERGF